MLDLAHTRAKAHTYPRLRTPRNVTEHSAVRPVRVQAIMLDGMEGSSLGVWIACGEGRALFPEPAVLEKVGHAVPRRAPHARAGR